ncbi:MAG TPA: ATP-binding protein [Puia sp.]|nr:ATP-binding protein [Puia sp.]
MYRAILLPLLAALTLPAIAQRSGMALVDSLTREIPKQKAPRDQVVLIYRLGYAYSAINLDSALYYSQMALRLAYLTKWTKSEGKSYTLIGLNLFYKGDYGNALKSYDSAIPLSQQANDTANWNMTLLNIGAVLNVQGNYSKAMQYFVQCLALDDKIHDNTNRAIALQNISNVYMQLKDTAKAIGYSIQAYDAYHSTNDLQGMALSLYTRGVIFDNQGKDSIALACYRESANLCRQAGNDAGLVRAMNGEGNLHMKKDELGPALVSFANGLALCRRLGLRYESAVMGLNCGQIYLQAVIDNKYSLPGDGEALPIDKRAAYLHAAHDYIFQAFDLNRQGNFDALKDNYLAISRWDSLSGNYRGALIAYQQYAQLQDSTFNSDNRSSIRELEAQHQLDIRDQQLRINQLELSRSQLAISRQNTQRWMYIGGIFFLGVIGALLFWQNRQRKKTNNTLQHLNARLDQANQVKTRLFGVLSHDLRSPISNLVSFLDLQKDNPGLLEPANAARHQQEITRSANNLLDTMEDLLLWSKEQMRHLSPQPHNIDIPGLFSELRLLYPDTNQCRLEFKCPPQLTLYTDENFLKTILRNLTTNAIKAVANNPNGDIRWEAATSPTIASSAANSPAAPAKPSTTLTITDNGPGLSPQVQAILLSPTGENSGKTLGLHLIREFATALGCTITIDTAPENGTSITLSFPFHHLLLQSPHFADPASS